MTIFALSFSTQRLFQVSFRNPKAMVRPRRGYMLSLGGRELDPSLSPCGTKVAADGTQIQALTVENGVGMCC